MNDTPDDLAQLQDPNGDAWENADPTSFMPYDSDEPEDGGKKGQKLFLLEPKTPQEFSAYIANYDFGTIPPDFIVLHHTGNPCTLRTLADARKEFDKAAAFDANEEGKSEEQIKAQRRTRVANVQTYYRDTLGWDTGPHLFIDDKWIWVTAEMREPGIHAMWGNSFKKAGHLHYSIGIEMVGYYVNQTWSHETEQLVGYAVAALRKRLGTFDIKYMYADAASKPGRTTVKNSKGENVQVCAHPERLAWGGISSHRDYNKPACPGTAITEDYYIGVIQRGVTALEGGGAHGGTTGGAVGGAVGGVTQPVKHAPTMTKARFTEVLSGFGSPAMPEGDALYDLAASRGINPAVALAFFVRLSRCGTGYANPDKRDNRNWGEIVGDGAGVDGMAAYPSWLVGLGAWCGIMDRYGNEGQTTLLQVVRRYQPGGTQDPDAYAQDLAGLIDGWK